MKKIMLSIKLIFLIIVLIALIIPFCKLVSKMLLDNKSVGSEEYISTNLSEMYEMYKENEVFANDTTKIKCVRLTLLFKK